MECCIIKNKILEDEMRRIFICLLIITFFTMAIGFNSTINASNDILDGQTPPSGTIASGASMQGYEASKAIDGDNTSYWNSGSISGEIELMFPNSVELSAIQISANASPSSNIEYTVYGYSDDQWTQISQSIMVSVNWNSTFSNLEPFQVEPGNYEGIRIKANSTGSSFIAVSEIHVLQESYANGCEEIDGTSFPSNTVTSGPSHPLNPSSYALDCDMLTDWNSGSYSGTLQLDFPEKINISALHLIVNVTPTSYVEYKIFGLNNGVWQQVADTFGLVLNAKPNKYPTILDPINITPGSYDAIKIEAAAGTSWVAITEVSYQGGNVCEGLEGFSFPDNVETSGPTYPNIPTSNAVDCDILTDWNAGNYSGALELLFPDEITISTLYLVVNATPTSYVEYRIYGLKDGIWNQVSDTVGKVINAKPNKYPTILEPISIATDSYDGIKIDVIASTSYVAISEITYSESVIEENIPNPDENLIPTLISNNSSRGIVEFSNAYYGDAFLAFDKQNNSVGWSPLNPNNQWLSYQFSTSVVINKYSITPVNHTVGPARAPKDWRFEGYDGTEWVVLDSRTAIDDWEAGVEKVFSFDNRNVYDKYRIYVLTNNGDPIHLSVGELAMMGYDSPVKNLVGITEEDTILAKWSPVQFATQYNIYLDNVLIDTIDSVSTEYLINALIRNTNYVIGVSAIVNNEDSSISKRKVFLPSGLINLVPKMLSNNQPINLIEMSNQTYNQGFYAFDHEDTSIGWSPSGVVNQWISYSFENPTVIKSYTIKPVNHAVGPSRAPKSWRFEGYNGTEWIVLDEQSFVSDWSAGLSKEFTINNGVAYTKYRLFVLENNGDPVHLSIGEIELLGKANSN
jgi:hypothetical protein